MKANRPTPWDATVPDATVRVERARGWQEAGVCCIGASRLRWELTVRGQRSRKPKATTDSTQRAVAACFSRCSWAGGPGRGTSGVTVLEEAGCCSSDSNSGVAESDPLRHLQIRRAGQPTAYKRRRVAAGRWRLDWRRVWFRRIGRRRAPSGRFAPLAVVRGGAESATRGGSKRRAERQGSWGWPPISHETDTSYALRARTVLTRGEMK